MAVGAPPVSNQLLQRSEQRYFETSRGPWADGPLLHGLRAEQTMRCFHLDTYVAPGAGGNHACLPKLPTQGRRTFEQGWQRNFAFLTSA